MSKAMDSEISLASTSAEAAISSSVNGNTLTLSDLLDYLDQVESHLRRPSVPASECYYSYQSDQNNKFFKYVGATLVKPMLRTLIYGAMIPENAAEVTKDAKGGIDWESEALRLKQRTEKVKFEERIREERVLLEFERMSSFIIGDIKPALLQLDQDLVDTFVPDLHDKIKQIEDTIVCVENGDKIDRKSLLVFSRLANGRYYKGKLGEMIADLFPQLTRKYEEASRVISEREVFERLIHVDLINKCRNREKSADEDLFRRRIKAAFECLEMFYPSSDECSCNLSDRGDRESGAESSHVSGKETEIACLKYIETTCPGSNNIILQNVFINARRSSDEKYKPPRDRRNKSTVIWTDEGGIDRYRVCSEFDILLLKQSAQDTHLIEVWEAKRTISPSTLYDVLSKKLRAVELLLDDKSAELTFDEGDETRALPFSQSVCEQQDSILTFGIYGSELLHPTNAADSIRSVAGANVVSSNLMEVILAMERCAKDNNSLLVVEVDTQRTLHIVEKLRALIKNKMISGKHIQILLYIEKGIDFVLER